RLRRGSRQGFENPEPYPRLGPSIVAVVGRCVGTIALGQVTPGRTRSQDKENPVQDAPVIRPCNATGLVGKQRRDQRPLPVSQVETCHSKLLLTELESRTGLKRNPIMSTEPSPSISSRR